MPETREELERQLQGFQEDKSRNESAILETRKLLEKVDKKRRENPSERQKWNSKLDSLETVLAEKKRLLTSSETRILQIQRKLEAGQFSESDSAKPPTPTSTPKPSPEGATLPDAISVDDLKNASQRLLTTHLIQLQSVSDLDYRMAKAFMGSAHAMNLSKDQIEEINKRIRMLDKTRGTTTKTASAEKKTPPTEATALTQAQLKSVLQKCESKDYGSITVSEVEIITKYARALAAKNPNASEVSVLNTAVSAIRTRLRDAGLD